MPSIWLRSSNFNSVLEVVSLSVWENLKMLKINQLVTSLNQLVTISNQMVPEWNHLVIRSETKVLNSQSFIILKIQEYYREL